MARARPAADLARLIGADGTLIISGILADAHEHVVTALAPLRTVETATQEGWAVVVLRPDDGRGMPDVSEELSLS
jgi:ribosomal protein L11 methylase PrmA